MFETICIKGTTITDQLLLRRIMDGSVTAITAVKIQEELSKGVYKDADEAIDSMGVMLLVNNRQGFDVVDELYKEKDSELMAAIFSEQEIHGISNSLLGKIMRRAKGHASPFSVSRYISVLKEKHKNELGR